MLIALILIFALSNGVHECRAHLEPVMGNSDVFGIPLPVDGATVNLKCNLNER
jgi:hypothetical protein